MKKLSLLVLLVVCYFVSSGQVVEKYKKINWRIYHSQKWREYVDYKSDEWKNMSIEDKNSLLQIPVDELKTMSTDQLISVSIDCIFARTIGKYSSMDKYYEEVYNSFNGFRELTAREDASIKLINYYKGMNIRAEAPSPAGLTIGRQVQILEYLIGHPKLLGRFNSQQMSTLLADLLNKYDEKTTTVDLKGDQNRISNVYAVAKVLERKDRQTNRRLRSIEHIDVFMNSGVLLTEKTRDQILSIGKGQ